MRLNSTSWVEALREDGFLSLAHPLFPPERCDAAIALARSFFALPVEEKKAIAIERSPHFRGYSEMRNERDWREQIHFGREENAPVGGPVYRRLQGPNLWPPDPLWRTLVMELLRDLEIVGREILSAIGPYLGASEPAYLLLKMIHYHASADARSGVAPHVDFSWITLVLQDEQGGLEMRTPRGEWVPATPERGRIVVNVGELLQFATGGYLQATPHRVRAGASSRYSLPFFLNPALDTVVRCLDEEHVHRVMMPRPFVFGEAEWARKGEGVWCGECVSP